ncbi:MAG TPA: glycosyltransferase family 39 protein [Thermoanaerobaculia bacterium]
MKQRVVWSVVLSIAAIKLALQFWASGSYGYFRDELYFIACGRHLDWGYVDHSPLVALYARLGENIGELFGPSLRGFRLIATLAGTLRIILTGVIAARLGGGRIAQGLACLTVLLAPIYLGIDSVLSMNVFEHLYWLGCLLVVIEIANGGSEKLWLVFGALAGLGLQNKHSMLFLGVAIVVALLLTPMRRSLAKPWIWMGGGVALLIFLPNLLWQYAHDFPTLELLRNVKESGKNVVLGPFAFVKQQVMMLNPFNAPLWITGLVALFFSKQHRFLAWTYIAVLTIFIALEGKDYYVAPIYPVLIAAGAVALERRRVLVGIAAVLVVIGASLSTPLALPLLSPEQYLAHQRRLGVEPSRTEVSHTSEMPQIFSDQFGWPEMVAKVARYYHSLPPDVRAKTGIYASNYGQAGAIDFYGRQYGLPPAICPHQHYYEWGTHGFTGESLIVISRDLGGREVMFETVKVFDRRQHPYAMPEENGPLYHVTRMKVPLQSVWPELRRWR